MAIANASENATLFVYKGFDYLQSELSDELRQSLYNIDKDYYDKRKEIIDQALLEVYFVEEVKKSKKSVGEIKSEQLKITETSEKEIKVFYEERKAQIPYEFEKVKDRIKMILDAQKIADKKNKLLVTIKKDDNFKLAISEPIAPHVNIFTENYPYKGNNDAKITIVEFSDYRCPHCQHSTEILDKISQKYTKELKIIHMDFPIIKSDGDASRLIAEGGVCADLQGKFWEYNKSAFAQQKSLDKNSPIILAKLLNLDEQKFKDCLTTEATKAKVKKSELEAIRLGLTSTPSIFINGKKVLMHDEQSLITEIEAILSKVEDKK
jgi:protein-disulfide isomerase